MSTGSEAKQERTVGTSRHRTVIMQNGQARREKKMADGTETRLNLTLTPKKRITAAQPPSRESCTLTVKTQEEEQEEEKRNPKAP